VAGPRDPKANFCRPVLNQAGRRIAVNSIIYLVGLVVVVLFILSILGLR